MADKRIVHPALLPGLWALDFKSRNLKITLLTLIIATETIC